MDKVVYLEKDDKVIYHKRMVNHKNYYNKKDLVTEEISVKKIKKVFIISNQNNFHLISVNGLEMWVYSGMVHRNEVPFFCNQIRKEIQNVSLGKIDWKRQNLIGIKINDVREIKLVILEVLVVKGKQQKLLNEEQQKKN